MNKKLLSLIVTFTVAITGVLSMPLISNADTAKKLYPYSQSQSNKTAKATEETFCSFTAGPYSISKVSAVHIFSDEDEVLDVAELEDGDYLYFIGKIQKIVLPADGKVTLSAELYYTDYYNDSIYMTLCTSKNLSSEVLGIESEEGQRAQDSINLKKGTYYLTIWRPMLLSNLIEEDENNEFSAWSANVFAGYQMNITNASISKISDKAYTGAKLSPSTKVTHMGKTLVKGTDYTVTYKNNTNPGKATATITGKGKYIGTKTVTFKITPKKATVSKVTSPKKKTLKVTWKKDTKATGYQVVIAKNSKFTSGKKTATITKNKTTSKTFTKLTSKKKYYVKVRAYKTIDSKKVYGTYSKYKTIKVK